MSNSYYSDRLAKTKALLEKYDDALLALATNPTQEYMLDTGSTRQRVTKVDEKNLMATRSQLLNEISVLDNRITGNGSFQAFPAW